MDDIVAQAESAHRDMSAGDDEEERQLLVQCATLLMKGKDLNERYSQLTADKRKESAELRALILEKMGDETCLILPNSSARYLRAAAAGGVSSVSPKMVEEAINALTMAEFRDSMERVSARERRKRVSDRRELTAVDGLIFAIFEKIKANKVSDKRTVKMTNTLERGVAEEDVKLASEDIQQLCDRLLAVQSELKKISANRKKEEDERKAKLEALEQEAQQILMDRDAPEEDVETTSRGNFKLRCKRSERFPPVRLTAMRDTLLPTALAAQRDFLKTESDVASLLGNRERLAGILQLIQAAFDARDPIISTKLSLDRVGSRLVDLG